MNNVKGWIPCKEREPEENKRYEVTFIDGKTGFATYLTESKRWYKIAITEPARVIAWRERLEPYQE